MSEETPAGDQVSFGESLLGMQGFSAARAKRYRAELEDLLVHRLPKPQRWTIGFMGAYLAVMLGGLAFDAVRNGGNSPGGMSPETRWAVAGSFMISGLIMGAWLIWVAVRGGFSRRVGDVMAIAIVLVFSGTFASLFIRSAWGMDEPTRTELLLGGVTLAACTIGGIALTIAQRMHRQTQERLLRIEYHLAEFMETHGKRES